MNGSLTKTIASSIRRVDSTLESTNTLPIFRHEVPPHRLRSVHLLVVAELALAFFIIEVAEGRLALPVLKVVLHIVELGAEETLVVAVAVFAVRIPLISGACQEVDIARHGLVDALASALVGALLELEVLRQEILFVALDTLALTSGRPW